MQFSQMRFGGPSSESTRSEATHRGATNLLRAFGEVQPKLWTRWQRCRRCCCCCSCSHRGVNYRRCTQSGPGK